MLPILKAVLASRTNWYTLNLSGETGIDDLQSFPTPARSGIRINTDGTIDKREGSTYTQIDSGTDWIIPNSAAAANFEFRCTNSGDTLNAGSDAVDTWLDLSGGALEWFVSTSVDAVSLNLTIEVRRGSSGAAVDSGVYTGTAESA